MAAEEILKLFDQNWFFSKHKEPSSPLPQRSNPEFVGIQESEDQEKPRELKIPQEEEEEEEEEEAGFQAPNVLVGRSMSDQNLMSSKTSLFGSSEDLFSPTSVLNVKPQTRKLQPILSGKEVNEFLPDEDSPKPEKVSDAAEEKKEDEEKKNKKKKKNKKHEVARARRRKSLSDLEFQELKGFMDLGFVFSEEDHKDSELVSILPGLQRLGRKNREDVAEENREDEHEEEEEQVKKRRNRVARPYLSEAWEFRGERKEKRSSAAMKRKFPAPANEVDMKDHLRLWAHTVASTVR